MGRTSKSNTLIFPIVCCFKQCCGKWTEASPKSPMRGLVFLRPNIPPNRVLPKDVGMTILIYKRMHLTKEDTLTHLLLESHQGGRPLGLRSTVVSTVSTVSTFVSKTLLNKLLFTELRILGPASAHSLLGVTLYFCLFICQQCSWSPALPTPQREAVVGGGGQGCAGPWGVRGRSPQKRFFSSERTKVPAFLSLPFWSLRGLV